MKKMEDIWFLYLLIIVLNTGILCDRNIEKRQPNSFLSSSYSSSSSLSSSSSSSSYSSSPCLEDANKFKCDERNCIDNKYICDGIHNCRDGSDETTDLCKTILKRQKRAEDIATLTSYNKIKGSIVKRATTVYKKKYNTKTHTFSNNIEIVCGRISPSFNENNSPWNVVIYLNTQEPNIFNMICEGTLISEDIVITGARCFYNHNYDVKGRKETIDKLLRIGIGKHASDLENADHRYVNVQTVYVHSDYNGISSLYKNDIAIIGLSTKVPVNDVIVPACIDWKRKYIISDDSSGKIVLYENSKKKTLFEIQSSYISRDACRKNYKIKNEWVTDDKFCADDSNTNLSISTLNSGAGLIYDVDNLYYFTGIRSYGNLDGNNLITAYTEVRYHINWIREHISKITDIKTKCKETDYNKKQCHSVIPEIKPTKFKPQSNLIQDIKSTTVITPNLEIIEKKKCVIPNIKGSIFSNLITSRKLSPGSFVNQNQLVNEECDAGYFKVDSVRYMRCTQNGQWETNTSGKLCLKKCPPLIIDKYSKIQCNFNDVVNDCSSSMINGTKVIQSCNPSYHFKNRQTFSTNELYCLPDGNWNGQILKCVPIEPLLKPIQVTTLATTTVNYNLRPIEKAKCVIPNMEGSIYSYLSTKQIIPPGSEVIQGHTINEDCTPGYFKIDRYRYMICEKNGKWDPDIPDKLCLKMCPPVIDDSLQFQCTFNGENVDCSKPMKNGTKIIPYCKVTHQLASGLAYPPTVLTCLPDGRWDRLFHSCVPICGKINYSNVRPMIKGGIKAKHGTAPWNVGLYMRNENSTYDLICGGTLISENLVVSAAHCFRDIFDDTNYVISNNGLYKISIGKYERDIEKMDNAFTQIVNPLTIYFHHHYHGSTGHYSNDIAIIVLPIRVKLSNAVLPVCIDWDKKYTISNGQIGKIVGWGKTELNIKSTTLLEAELPYIDQLSCRKIYSNAFQSYITEDKFCAGSQSGSGVHEGDSGSGLSFPRKDLYYLTGIVSLDDQTMNDSIAVFTDVRYHITWIHKIYTTFN